MREIMDKKQTTVHAAFVLWKTQNLSTTSLSANLKLEDRTFCWQTPEPET